MQFDEFLKVLELLQNPDKFKAAIEELQTRQAAVEDALAQLKLGQDIDKARKQVTKLQEQAQYSITAAETQAREIVSAAQAAFDKRHAEVQAREVVADQALANYNTIKSQWASREDALRQQEKQLNAAREQLNKDLDALREKQIEVDARLEKLRQVMG
jgi:chromosome segregation ATPase